MAGMPDGDGGSPLVRNILMVVGGIFMIGTTIFMVQAYNRLNDMEDAQRKAQKDVVKKLDESTAQTRAQVNVLADKVGMTHKELSKKATDLQVQEQATQARLKADEEATTKQFGQVATDVSGVKGDVTKVASDVTDTKADLATTKGKLEHAIGDLNQHSELIAKSHDELEFLKHRGDRDYFEFTLHKGKAATHVSIISLELKKVDPKKSKFTLNVLAEDKRIEKKDRNINEPLQFYTGRERALFEVVINSVTKDEATGYLSTPKNAATAQMPSHGATPQ
jgi:chromosome segregation ATPase